MRNQLLWLLVASLLTCTACASDKPSPPSPGTNEAASPNPADTVDLPAHPAAGASEEFWEFWGDGNAELATYRGQIARYGELRRAEVVLIYVTEPHDRRTWVKDDAAPDDQKVQVLKLNHVAKFRTGIYPYSVMTSVFSPVADWERARFQPVKMTLTAQEWCGHVFHGLWAGSEAFATAMHSYFKGEGDAGEVVDTPEDVLYEDALFVQLRELDGPFANGESWRGHIVPRLWQGRKEHVAPRPVEASITRAEVTRDGQPATRFTLTYADQVVYYDVARDYPHRLLHWQRSDGTELSLVGHKRLPYWRLNEPGDQRHLRDIGAVR
jgi:hypothetical protein